MRTTTTLDYVRRRTAEGKSKREIIRCLKRVVARAIFGYLCRVSKPTRPEQISA
jgi:transposase